MDPPSTAHPANVDGRPIYIPSGTETSIIVSEFLFTFALVFVILNVATSESNEGNGYYGAAIALVVLAGALTVGSISLASFNPAASLSMVVVGKMATSDLWLLSTSAVWSRGRIFALQVEYLV
ncbi:MAG: aquaporin [Candidatus Thalassarchaeaceae archaeon]